MSRVCLSFLCLLLFAGLAQAEPVDFQRDIRPILSDKCFACHGPDEEHRGGELRLDTQDGAWEWAIVPGKPDESEVIARIESDIPEVQMPPASADKHLTDEERQLFRDWIKQGAEYEVHWAFQPPTRPEVPQNLDASWIKNPIDAFVLQRLQREGLSPSTPADRVTWLRRVSLDLIGLPPTIAEVDAYLADDSAEADAKQIERLLASPHFGERWGRIWLDAARYADSDGYEKDKPREMWFYRDWVVNAFNADMPYDEFIIQQIAGDLLPEPSQREMVATGFLRNSMINEEGGADPEQFRMEAMFDRMDAVGKAVLGLTTQCAQCHTHKYDPLTQHDYYRMFAFLNNTHDAVIPVYTESEEEQRRQILAEIHAIEAALKQQHPDWQQEMAAWEAGIREDVQNWEVLEPLETPFEGQKFRVLPDHSIVSEGFAPKGSSPEFLTKSNQQQITGMRLELLTHPQLPRRGPGRSIRGTAAVTEFKVYVAPADQPDKKTEVKIVSATADVNPTHAPQPEYLHNRNGKDDRVTGPIEYAIDGDNKTAWTTDSDPGRRNQARKAVFVFEQPVGFEQGTLIFVKPVMNHGGWNSDDNHNCLMGRYRFSVTTDAAPTADPLPRHVRDLLDVPAQKRTSEQQAAVFLAWRKTKPDWAEQNEKIEQLWQRYPEGTTQLVLEKRNEPRVTAVLNRGDFLSPTDHVEPGVPEFLHKLPEGDPTSRLTFARWLVDEQSPTTARAIVNRIWQAYFGIGIVETSGDLGSQSTPPSHPELLDWLAVELMDNNWSLKHIHRLITNSATYRQSSHVTPELQERDPYNRLLARGPRFRVHAEVVRDSTLAASGLLNRTVGGRPVYPPAPDFLFQPPASYGPKTWNEEADGNRYRRSIYTFRFRSVPYPMLETFDAVPGNVSCVRRNRSNTPLQALTMLNEPLSMECARALAELTLQQQADSDAERLTFAVRRCLSRQPAAGELATLEQLLDKQRQRIQSGELQATEILGEQNSESLDDAEQAAWTLVARVLLSLDESMTKE
ncbi:PSD1 and planctomycete cytochrome C domain-containing protein [Rubinisphaera brasiliensis]|uniref:Cytochrome c domain-containing protein n=1 Tax=Rubinisphaera brasiliensis (strain ATCC 49424 / DSM 5305 / JCM 21570 / IAM 15109 / NBRC 103401 / IFAM 1448) TaxID=756272 RepID=F0ST57_RUBBR|nr:PSD1 and planctomycete cytochrome C domain-containing protein [Rubinisphaera brasiliensis]ADY59268.1 protein of unknown function DUF1549 [Rubinisphaera brasiliensis DSM 5305]